MPNFILLTGAGFSRNWGGWLGKEVFEYLLSCPEIFQDPHLKKVLWDNKDNGFEEALNQIQFEFLREKNSKEKIERLEKFNRALKTMFAAMQKGFVRLPEGLAFPSKTSTGKVKNFLIKFQAIFTLNQDLLLETHYHGSCFPIGKGWDGAVVPGVKKGPIVPSGEWHVGSEDDFKVPNRCQPYFKLHGSYQWSGPASQNILIMGGHKTRCIFLSFELPHYFL
ncbi:MAG: hypothetical protein K8R48_08405 [Alphaproteobacteria bacterium]|nr:hypothetical protein [Alphaproteobacteria bacterium]